jgi:hypothetical protein
LSTVTEEWITVTTVSEALNQDIFVVPTLVLSSVVQLPRKATMRDWSRSIF